MRDDERRIAELEKQLMDLRKSAVSMVVGVSEAVAQTPEERANLAWLFEMAAENETGESQKLARLVAEALRAK